jgi:hypothetical protein
MALVHGVHLIPAYVAPSITVLLEGIRPDNTYFAAGFSTVLLIGCSLTSCPFRNRRLRSSLNESLSPANQQILNTQIKDKKRATGVV